MAHKSKRSPGDINSTESAEDILKRIVPQGHRGLMRLKYPFCSYSKHTHPTLFKGHLRIHTGEKPYKCGLCDKRFAKEWNLQTHNVFCQRTQTQKKLKVHLNDKEVPQLIENPLNITDENPRRINKEDSDKMINSTESAEDILKRFVPQGHRGQMMMKCPFCSYSKHTHPTLFENHLRIHTGEKPYKCGLCNKGFNENGNMKKHRQSCTSNQKKVSIHLTDKKFRQVIISPIHTTTRTSKEDMYSSPKPTGSRKSETTKHDLKLNHASANAKEHSKIFPQCFICFKKFCSLKELHAHLSVHTVDKPYICPVCKGGFFQWEALKNHSIIHSEENSKVSEEIVLESKLENEKANQLNPEVKSENKTVTNAEAPPLKLSKEPSHKACICNYCKIGFTDENDLIVHSKIHLDLGENRQWGCNHCQETFLSHGELNSHHRESHRNEKQWLCQQCRKRVRCSTELIRHLYIHTGEKPFECNMCDKAFNQKIGLVLHLRSHTAGKALKYSIGDQAFNRKGSLEIRSRSHTGEKKTKLVFQPKVMGVESDTKSPLDEEISNLPSHKKIKDDEVSKTSKCANLPSELSEENDHEQSRTGHNRTNIVFKPIITKVDLESESSTDEDIKNLRTCDKKLEQEQMCFTNTESIAPKNSSHEEMDNDTDGEKLPKHNTCRRGFNLKRNLKVRNVLRTGEKSFKCNICQKRFNKKSNLKTHVYTHSEERRFKCNKCNKGFRAKRNLDAHSRSHTGENEVRLISVTNETSISLETTVSIDETPKYLVSAKDLENQVRESVVPTKTIDDISCAISKSFICKCCKTGFIEPTTSKLHSKTHAREKPWICNHNHCQKSFPERTQLNSHLGISHRKITWICQECKKRFNNSTSLWHHLFIHTGEKPFKCNICTLRFAQKGCLGVHLRVHTGEKPFKCSICYKGFNQKINLTRHARTHTGEKPFMCDTCNKRFLVEYKFRAHLRLHTQDKRTILLEDDFQPDVTTVHLDLETQTPGEQNNIQLLQGDMETGCEISSDPEKQVIEPSPEVTVISDMTIKVKPSVCKYCKTGFVNPSPSSHIHTGNERWICNHCQQSFPRETILKYHYRKFHRGKQHCICEECKKRFKFLSELSNHLLEHTGEKPNKCTALDSHSDQKRARKILGARFTVRKNSECTVTELTEDKSNESEPLRQISDHRNNDTTSFNINPEERARQWSCFLNVFNVKIAKQVMTHS